MTTQRPVFYDPSASRWPRLRKAALGVSIVLTVLFGVLVFSILVNPALPSLNLPSAGLLPSSAHVTLPLRSPIVPPQSRLVRRAKQRIDRERQVRDAEWRRLAAVPRPSGDPLAFGFFVNWDESSTASLKENVDRIDVLVPEWLHMIDANGAVIEDAPPRRDEVLEYLRARRPTLRLMPLINNSDGREWLQAPLVAMLGSPNARARVIEQSLAFVKRISGSGISIDFENVPEKSQPGLQAFVGETARAFHAAGLLVSINLPANEATFDYRRYSASADYVIVMAYDEHWPAGTPGPISSLPFFMDVLRARLADVPPAKLVMAIGGYAYDWPGAGGGRTFEEAMLTAKESEAEISVDQDSLNPTYRYKGDEGREHEVWFLDAMTAFNAIAVTRSLSPQSGFALWRLGSEDPAVWSFLGGTGVLDQTALPALAVVRYGYGLDYEGTGEILQVTSLPTIGSRELTWDSARAIIANERFTALPAPYVVTRHGAADRKVALTFDDGPDAGYTPGVLDALRSAGVPGTFFVTGLAGEQHPDLLRREAREGHQIGNHTFTHPNIANISRLQLRVELTATQRLLEGVIGRRTVLFRPPYAEDTEPDTPDQVAPLEVATSLGYVTVGMQVDPGDWRRPGVDEIVSRTVAQAVAGRGNIILLHDGGGDRSQTIEAIPRIAEALRQRGFTFVTVGDLLGRKPDDVMPPVPPRTRWESWADAGAFAVVNVALSLMSLLFVIATALGISRLVFVGSLAVFERMSRHVPRKAPGDRKVAVIVPAFNEAKVIVQTLQSLLRTEEVPGLEIIVVDDGSTDGTAERVRQAFAGEPRIHLCEKPNAGKAAALNYGLTRTDAEVVVALDADTVFTPMTISRLVRHFTDPRVGAVAGNAKVGNRVNMLTRWQALEYVTSQNLDRRAFDVLDCITVVPGSVGAWRRKLVLEAGGFSHTTLAEDADLTITINRMGYSIVYDDEAVAYTEAPETFGAFVRQRHRWMFGTFQAAWKHKDLLFRRRAGALGFVALPNIFIFQVIFPLISPVMDLMLASSVGMAAFGYWQHPQEFVADDLWQVLFYYALFQAVDFLAAALAFALERREDWRLLWLVFLQRFVYRQVMYYVALRAVLDSLRGGPVGWHKLDRHASVRA